MDYKINMLELEALYGLPHVCQIVYFRALRPYMDYATGIVGIRRGVSHQSLSEQCYVEAHSGYKGSQPSHPQIRRAIERLVHEGILQRQSEGRRLILKCLLASTDISKQNQLVRKASEKPVTPISVNNPAIIECSSDLHVKLGNEQHAEADTPPVTGKSYKTHTNRAVIKTRISNDYFPSDNIIQKAKNIECNTVTCQFEIARFIAYHSSKGTLSYDWDAEYYYWVLNGKRSQQGGKNNVKNAGYTRTKSAVERVHEANKHFFEDHIQQSTYDNQARHCLVMDSDD